MVFTYMICIHGKWPITVILKFLCWSWSNKLLIWIFAFISFFNFTISLFFNWILQWVYITKTDIAMVYFPQCHSSPNYHRYTDHLQNVHDKHLLINFIWIRHQGHILRNSKSVVYIEPFYIEPLLSPGEQCCMFTLNSWEPWQLHVD